MSQETKSVRQQLSEGYVLVNHQDQSANFDLPEWMKRTSKVLDDEEQLVQELRNSGNLLGVIHQGLAQCIIGVRAKARPVATKSNPEPKLDTATQRKKVQEYQAPTLPKPKDELAEATSAIQKLLNKGFTKEQILEMIG